MCTRCCRSARAYAMFDRCLAFRLAALDAASKSSAGDRVFHTWLLTTSVHQRNQCKHFDFRWQPLFFSKTRASYKRMAPTPGSSLAGLAVGTKRGLDKPLPTAELSKQQRHVSSKGQSGAAATAGLGKASQQEPQELQYATLAQSVAEGPVLKSLMVGPLYFALQCIHDMKSTGYGSYQRLYVTACICPAACWCANTHVCGCAP